MYQHLSSTSKVGNSSVFVRGIGSRSSCSSVVPAIQARQASGGRGRGSGRRGRGRGRRGRGGKSDYKRLMLRSDGSEHLGSALDFEGHQMRPFPGPPPGEGPPLRVLPIGGLGEIGMNCMLIGVHDRYILVDAGLMFPDFTDYGMQKILPDTSFLAQWKDKIEGVFITHGHEDHIGAMAWVVPGLDPSVPIYAGAFCMQLVKRRMQEFNLWNEDRFHVFEMRKRFQLGPFEVEPFRVTHSIPDCCGMVLRSEHGTILHTGDWKIDEKPVDGDTFDRDLFEQVGKEGVTLMMSDSTNVLASGRTNSETDVATALINRVDGHTGRGRVITTCFASNMHRITSIKKAADATDRKLCFMGMSLHTYLEAAWKVGRAPFDPRELIHVAELEDYKPSEVLIVTTGSQAEPRSALNMASIEASHQLKLRQDDLVMYAAKIIPGNDKRVMKMINRIAESGVDLAYGSSEGLHASGHAYKDELDEILKMVKPQHFLPVHGEFAFLCAHAELARESGCIHTEVIRNGQMLGVRERPNRRHVSSASLAQDDWGWGDDPDDPDPQPTMDVLGEAQLTPYYNDGEKGTGTYEEMGLEERQSLAFEGVIVAALDVARVPATNDPSIRHAPPADIMAQSHLRAKIRVTSRGMWTGSGRMLQEVNRASEAVVARLPGDASLVAIERVVTDAVRRAAKQFNNRRPEIIVIVHEFDPRAGSAAAASARQRIEEQRAAGEPVTNAWGLKKWQVPPEDTRTQSSAGGWSQPGSMDPSSSGSSDGSDLAAAAEVESSGSTHRDPVQNGGGGPPKATPAPAEMLRQRQKANPRETPDKSFGGNGSDAGAEDPITFG